MKTRVLVLFFLLLCTFVNAQQARLVLPLGHTARITSAQFSSDRKYVISSSEDKTARIYETSSGKELHVLKGHNSALNTAEFSHDSKIVVTASDDQTARIWEVASGKLIHDLIGHTSSVISAQFSPDSKIVVTASRDNTAKIWNTKTGKLLHVIEGRSAEFSPNGKTIVTATSDTTACIWDASTGKLIHLLEGHTEKVQSAYFSTDGKYVVTSSGDMARIYDTSNGEEFTSLEHDDIISAEFSPDGMYLLTKSEIDAYLWEISSGEEVDWFDSDNFEDNIISIIHPDGKSFLNVDENSFRFKSIPDGIEIGGKDKNNNNIYKLRANLNNLVDISIDGEYLLIANKFDVEIYQIINEDFGDLSYLFPKKKHVLKGETKDPTSAEFSPDGSQLVIAFADSSFSSNVCEFNSGQTSLILKGHTEKVQSAHYSPDSKTILTASGSTYKIWNATNGKLLFDVEENFLHIKSSSFSSDSKYVIGTGWSLSGSQYGSKYSFYEIASGKELPLPEEFKELIYSKHFFRAGDEPLSHNGKHVVIASDGKSAGVYDLKSGKELFIIKGNNEEIRTVRFSPDGKYVLAVLQEREESFLGYFNFTTQQRVLIFDSENGKLLNVINGHNGSILSLHFSHDDKYLVTVGADDKTMFWNVATGKLLYTRLQLKNNDWLVYDEHYRFDGSPGGIEKLYFTCGLEVIELSQLKDALYVPGLVNKKINGQDINYPKLSSLEICGILPLVEQNEDKQDDGYHFKITPRAFGLAQIDVKVNSKTVKTLLPNELTKKGDMYLLDMPKSELEPYFVKGEKNTITATGIVNKNGNELRSRGVVITEKKEGSKVTPNLYAVMVGVNNYKDDRLDLQFPVKDAISLGTAIEQSAKKLLGEDHVFMYHINSEVTKEKGFTTPEKIGVKRAFEAIGKSAKAEDVILVFFAGHGVMQGAEDKKFTFLTAEASKDNPVGISTTDLESWLSPEGPHKLLANKAILIFDACNSGQATEELIALARNDDASERIRQVDDLKDKSGMFILAASAPNQSAYELPQYQQGLLTYCLLNTLKNNPDVLDEERFLNVQKWFLESEEELSRLVRSLGYKQDAQPFGTANIRIGEVDDEVRSGIVLAEQKPVVLCANAINTVLGFDDMDLKKKVNAALSDILQRGVKAKIIYVPGASDNANNINLTYSIKGEDISCDIILVKAREMIYKEKVSGKTTDLDSMIQTMIQKIEENSK